MAVQGNIFADLINLGVVQRRERSLAAIADTLLQRAVNLAPVHLCNRSAHGLHHAHPGSGRGGTHFHALQVRRTGNRLAAAVGQVPGPKEPAHADVFNALGLQLCPHAGHPVRLVHLRKFAGVRKQEGAVQNAQVRDIGRQKVGSAEGNDICALGAQFQRVRVGSQLAVGIILQNQAAVCARFDVLRHLLGAFCHRLAAGDCVGHFQGINRASIRVISGTAAGVVTALGGAAARRQGQNHYCCQKGQNLFHVSKFLSFCMAYAYTVRNKSCRFYSSGMRRSFMVR